MKEQESMFERYRKEFSEMDMTDLEYSEYDMSKEEHVPEDFQCYKESKNLSKAKKPIILDGNNYIFEVLRGESDYDSTAPGVVNSSGIKDLGTSLRNIINKTIQGHVNRTGREALDTAFNAGQIPQNVWDNIFVSFFDKQGYIKDDVSGTWKKIYTPEK